MKRLCTMIGLLFAWCSLSVAQPLPVTAVQIGRHIDITAGDKYITSYRFQDDEKYPFFYPVNGPVSISETDNRINLINAYTGILTCTFYSLVERFS